MASWPATPRTRPRSRWSKARPASRVRAFRSTSVANQTASVTGSDTFQGEVGPAQRDAFLTAMLASERPPQPQGVAPPPVVAAMPGGDDLAQYGSWSDSPEYGQVWYPQVAQDWVPYREGRWAYVAPWGWTWVDSAPWGFAPFHYGRWVEAGGRWGWIPGGGVGAPRPVYAPALVTFLGVGAVAGIGIGAALAGGRVGWLPLGPREPFRPWYRASDRYFRQVNVAHVTNFTTINRDVTINNFANRRAATVVPTSAMTASRPVGTSFQRVDPAQLAQARPVFGQQPLRPAPTTVGVTPVVARQLGLPPSSPSLRTDRAGTHVPCRAGWRLDRRRRGGGGGSSRPCRRCTTRRSRTCRPLPGRRVRSPQRQRCARRRRGRSGRRRYSESRASPARVPVRRCLRWSIAAAAARHRQS